MNVQPVPAKFSLEHSKTTNEQFWLVRRPLARDWSSPSVASPMDPGWRSPLPNTSPPKALIFTRTASARMWTWSWAIRRSNRWPWNSSELAKTVSTGLPKPPWSKRCDHHNAVRLINQDPQTCAQFFSSRETLNQTYNQFRSSVTDKPIKHFREIIISQKNSKLKRQCTQ